VRDHPASATDAPALLLAHGAGAGEDHPWMKRVAQGLSERGVRVRTFNFPYLEEGRRLPNPAGVLEAAMRSAWEDMVAATPAARVRVAGGKSMGGRIASQVSARQGFTPPPAGLVFFGYPLHPPGKPTERRDRHLPSLAQPALFIHGTRDPFGSLDEMRDLTSRLPGAMLDIVDGGDHSLVAPKRVDPSEGSLTQALDRCAAWILALASD
jgi:predicted alpha/beta-hydrolase family hydrolase